MARIILGIIIGFVVWSIVWIGSEQTLATLSPAWFGAYSLAAEKALVNGTSLDPDPMLLVVNILRSVFASLIAGYMCALAAGEYRRSTMVLGIILVLVGIAVEAMFWKVAPAWYHFVFILFLYPMTVLGGRLRRRS